MWLADGDRERDRETERPLGAEPDRDRDLERLEERQKNNPTPQYLVMEQMKDNPGIMLLHIYAVNMSACLSREGHYG